MNTILTDEQVSLISAIMVIRFREDNEEEIKNEMSVLIYKHNLTGLAKMKFETEFLFFKIKEVSAMN